METEFLLCPLCHDKVNRLLYRFHFEQEQVALERIRQEHPGWTQDDGFCSRCADYYHTQIVMEQRLLPELGPYFPVKSPDDFIILPTPLRLDADARFSGKGITIAVIDSGFFPHDDLVLPVNRLKAYVDIGTGMEVRFDASDDPRNHPLFGPSSNAQWHGTMTAVVCAGNGYRSRGLYRSLAPEALLVLVKVQDEQGRITAAALAKAFAWIVANSQALNIRVVNVSLGVGPAAETDLEAWTRKLASQGLLLVAASGNRSDAEIEAPARYPEVIAVGGIDDQNSLINNQTTLYPSSYGEVATNLHKPELLAQAIWLAAPILPGTAAKQEAEWLHASLSLSDDDVQKNRAEWVQKLDPEIGTMQGNVVTFVKQKLISRIRETKFFSPDYMHVDGTSFAAPLVCACIAQLLEAEPTLKPRQIRQLLFSTASRIPQLPVEKQGFGAIRPRKAILKILKKGVIMKPHVSPFINRRKKTIEFYIQNDCAQQISLAGSFNHWAQDVLLMEPGSNGVWKIAIPMLPDGTYRYKFFIDDRMWVEDVDNPYREPDGLNGWNSLLEIQR